MFGINNHIVVIDHEEEKVYYSEGQFADQYFNENGKTEKYEFYTTKGLIEFVNEQKREYKKYEAIKVESY